MTQPTLPPHCPDESLHDWIDDRLDAAAREAVTRHCATCPACADRAAALRRVVAAARAAPPAIAPPDPAALERAILAAVAAQRRPAAHAAPRAPIATRRRRAIAWRLAAGIALVATTAAVTARLVRRDAPAVAATAGTPRDARPPAATPVRDAMRTPVDVAALRIETDHTLAALRAAAAAGDQVLAAETLRVLERSLATIDAAIAEADAALARDPGNAALAALLARTYERKRELVLRGAMLGSRS